MTHRGLTHEFVVVSGHLPPGHPKSLVDWAAIARLRGTVVVLMGVDTAPAIAAALVEHGRAPETPVAIICDGSTASAAHRPDDPRRAARDRRRRSDVRPPAVWVVGEVVDLGRAPSAGRTGRRRPRLTSARRKALVLLM